MELSKETKLRLEKLYRGKKHTELTIGILKDGKQEVLHLDPQGNPVDTKLVYPVGSICKLFNAALLAKYLDQGKLRLEDSLSRYIPGLPQGYYPTLRRLATHSSGYGTAPFTNWDAVKLLLRMNRPGGIFRTNPYHGTVREQEMLEILKNKKLQDRDYPFQYSNFAMGVLGYILGSIDGAGYWDTMERFLREDLGLTDARLGNTDMPGYDKKDQPCNCWPWDREDVVVPAGALLSSVEDLLTFAQAQLDGSRPWLEICHEKHGQGEKTYESGLAWRLEKGTDISWHDGAAGAYSAFLGVDRKKKTAVALAVNYGLVNTKELAMPILQDL